MTQPELFFDIGSPYSYMAFTQLETLESEADTTILLRPVLLGAVFQLSGNASPALLPARAAYLIQDLMRWSAEYDVPFTFNPAFPANMLSTQRALVAAEQLGGQAALRALAQRCFDAFWTEQRDVTQPAELAALAGEAGLDGEAILALIATPEVKERLKAATEALVARGAFGLPTYFVGEAMFFGNDRIPFVRDAILAEERLNADSLADDDARAEDLVEEGLAAELVAEEILGEEG